MFAVKLLLKQVVSLKCNSYRIFERVATTPFSVKPSFYEIGRGLTVRHSFINHSCNSNAAEITRRRDHIIYAKRPIRSGEQVRNIQINLIIHLVHQLDRKMHITTFLAMKIANKGSFLIFFLRNFAKVKIDTRRVFSY